MFSASVLIKILIFIFFISFSVEVSAQDSIKTTSFSKQNKRKNYTSVSFGMGVTYSNNPSLIKYVELDVPNYVFIPNNDKVSDFSTGVQFFGGVEFQISKTFSVKPEYSYNIKSINVPSNTSFRYLYITHQPVIMLNYVFMQEYSYIKFGLGGGYFLSNFTREERTIETKYNSSGIGLKLEGTLNAQIGKSAAVYLGAFVMQTLMSDLKSKDDVYLQNLNNERVNLNSFGVGLRLGAEIFFF